MSRSGLSQVLARRGTKTRFVVVGVWNTIFGYCAFALLDTLFSAALHPRYVAYMLAMCLAQILAVINAYIWHRRVTFASETRGVEALTEFLRFSGTYVVTSILSLVLLPFFVEVFGIAPKVAAALIVVICTVVSYLGHSRFTFGDRGVERGTK